MQCANTFVSLFFPWNQIVENKCLFLETLVERMLTVFYLDREKKYVQRRFMAGKQKENKEPKSKK